MITAENAGRPSTAMLKGTDKVYIPNTNPHKTWNAATTMRYLFRNGSSCLTSCQSACTMEMCIVFPAGSSLSSGAELYSYNGNDIASIPVVVAAILTIFCAFNINERNCSEYAITDDGSSIGPKSAKYVDQYKIIVLAGRTETKLDKA